MKKAALLAIALILVASFIGYRLRNKPHRQMNAVAGYITEKSVTPATACDEPPVKATGDHAWGINGCISIPVEAHSLKNGSISYDIRSAGFAREFEADACDRITKKCSIVCEKESRKDIILHDGHSWKECADWLVEALRSMYDDEKRNLKTIEQQQKSLDIYRKNSTPYTPSKNSATSIFQLGFPVTM